MTVARREGEFIEGEEITYGFGRAIETSSSPQVTVQFGLHGRAKVVKRYRPVAVGAQPKSSPPGHDLLEAKTALGVANGHKQDHRKSTLGSHRVFTGVLRGSARVTVRIPMGP
jgi:hypothetical protein